MWEGSEVCCCCDGTVDVQVGEGPSDEATREGEDLFRRGSDDGVGQSVGPDVRGGEVTGHDKTRQDDAIREWRKGERGMREGNRKGGGKEVSRRGQPF